MNYIVTQTYTRKTGENDFLNLEKKLKAQIFGKKLKIHWLTNKMCRFQARSYLLSDGTVAPFFFTV